VPRFDANLSMLYGEHAFLDRFAAARADGFTGVEYLFPYAWPQAALVDALGANGLQQVLFNLPPGDWEAGDRGLACDPDRVGAFQESVGLALDYAAALGCPQCHCMVGLAPAGVDPERLEATLVDNLRFAAAACRDAGVKLLIEAINHRDMPGFHLNTSAQAMDLIEKVGVDNLYFQYDVYHMQIMEGDITPTFQHLIDRIAHVQIADTPGRHEPGTGELNWPFLFAMMDRAGYTGWVGCEYRPLAGTSEGLGWLRDWTAGNPPT
jgi:hydroxypyruvate isomerase